MSESVELKIAQQNPTIHALERRIAQLEREKKLLLDAHEDGYWDWNLQTNQEFMSDKFWQNFGYDPETRSHCPSAWEALVHPQDIGPVREAIQRHLESDGKIPYGIEARFRHARGDWLSIYCRGKIVEWDEHEQPLRMVGTHTNITELKKIQLELERSNSSLKAFAYSASHDLQEPLRTILNYSRYLLDSLGPKLDEDSREDLNFICEASLRLKSLVANLLVFSQVGKSEEMMKRINVNSILYDLEEDLSTPLAELKGKLKIKKIPDVFGVGVEIRSLFQNLISNAIKYHSDKPPVIEIKGHCRGEEVLIEVKDNGIGIPLEYQERIFEPFRRVDSKVSGSGIGLATCRKIVDYHGGDISLHSEPGKGAVFTLILPGASSEEESEE